MWSHATCWTKDFPFAADITTFFYQYNTPPWNAQLKIDSETRQALTSTPDQRTVEVLAREVLQAELSAGALEDVTELQKFIRALLQIADKELVAIYSSGGKRQNQWAGSPVQSSRFG